LFVSADEQIRPVGSLLEKSSETLDVIWFIKSNGNTLPIAVSWVMTQRTEALPVGKFMAVGSSNLPIVGEFMAVGSSNLPIGGHRISLVGEFFLLHSRQVSLWPLDPQIYQSVVIESVWWVSFFVTVTMRSLLSWYWVPSYATCCLEDI
jgi:hypothetical protein